MELIEMKKEEPKSSETDSSKPCTTPDGKIWPANMNVPCPERFFCTKFSKERIQTLLTEQCLKPEDGELLDLWVLTRIDHWDHDQECTVCLTDQSMLLVGVNFITEKVNSEQRIPLSAIHTVRVGNLVSPQWSVLSGRDYGAVQLVWGAVNLTRWSDWWNPTSREVPMATFHHHPCFYSNGDWAGNDLYNCDLFVQRLTQLLDPLAVQPVHENIRLNCRFNVASLFFNQSALGFCKDRNGLSF